MVARHGRYKALVVLGPLLIALGAGLIYSADFLTQLPRVLGFQVFCGIGVAFFLQNAIMAAQVEMRSEPRFISRAIGLVNFWAFLSVELWLIRHNKGLTFLALSSSGRVLGISVSTSIFENLLPLKLRHHAPELSPAIFAIVLQSIDAIRSLVPEAQRAGVIEAYRLAIRVRPRDLIMCLQSRPDILRSVQPVFLFAMAAAILSSAFALLIKNDSVHESAQATSPAAAQGEAVGQTERDLEKGSPLNTSAGE